jgi:hypothetical protein
MFPTSRGLISLGGGLVVKALFDKPEVRGFDTG